MSQGKRILAPYQIFNSQSMLTSFDNSINPTGIVNLDNIGFLIQMISGNAIGSFQIYGGIKKYPNNVSNPGFVWAPLNLAVKPAAGSAYVTYAPVTETAVEYIYLAYTATSGNGVLNAWIMGKAY